MKILAISGSAAQESSNEAFLSFLSCNTAKSFEIIVYNKLRDWPLFRPEDLDDNTPTIIETFRSMINSCDAIIISTPEYVHNMPAVLKNMFEWTSASGEFQAKKVIAITLTPHPPRGEHAMKSLLQSLLAAKSTVVAHVDFYKSKLFKNNTIELEKEDKELIHALFSALKS